MNGFPSVLESIYDLDRGQIERLCETASGFKHRHAPAPIPPEQQKTVCTLFLERSTRTKNSFAIAAHRLGHFHLDFDATTSSMGKGESIEETLRTLAAQGVALCIVRTPQAGLLSSLRAHAPLRLVNGGDGPHQHPTQVLTDLFTMLEADFHPKNRRVVVIGDSAHSRVSRSLCELLSLFKAKPVLCGPPEFMPNPLPQGVEVCGDLERAVGGGELLYLLRIQKERHQGLSTAAASDYHDKWGIDADKLARWNADIPIFHPGPTNIGVEIAQDVLDSPNYRGYDQVRHSIFMRMAIIAASLDNADAPLEKRYTQLFDRKR